MATLDYFAEAPLSRTQTSFFSPSLDSRLPEGHQVRFFDKVLDAFDWEPWNARYERRFGQPPIPPRKMASGILWGLLNDARSSRALEETCEMRLDFIWLMEGFQPDHTTFAKFRTANTEQLDTLFQFVVCSAMEMGMVSLGEVAFDGTRVRASNSRYATRTQETIERLLAACELQFEKAMAEWEANDEEEDRKGLPRKVPAELAALDLRRAELRGILEQILQMKEQRRSQGVDPEKNPPQIPMTDSDSRVMPNKDGGFAPNYTPTATTDGDYGIIIDCGVTNCVNETLMLTPSVDCIAETLGQMPQAMLTDAGNNAGRVMAEMEDRGVEFYAPAESKRPQADNPALREDPTQPVPEELHDQLPRSRGKLDKSCFVYDEEKNLYYCPQGRTLEPAETVSSEKCGEKVVREVFRSPDCSGCQLMPDCLSNRNQRGGRTVSRDAYEEVRERTAERVSSEEGRKLYNRRGQIAETPFAYIKSQLGLRQFLLRGIDKVRMEWKWAATAFNLRKMILFMAAVRADSTPATAEG